MTDKSDIVVAEVEALFEACDPKHKLLEKIVRRQQLLRDLVGGPPDLCELFNVKR